MNLVSISNQSHIVVLNENCSVLFSYGIVVGVKAKDVHYVLGKKEPERSNTTARHISNWLGSAKNVIELTAEQLAHTGESLILYPKLPPT